MNMNELASSLLLRCIASMHRVYSVSICDIFMWKCEMYIKVVTYYILRTMTVEF
jgi:hypothetical protein